VLVAAFVYPPGHGPPAALVRNAAAPVASYEDWPASLLRPTMPPMPPRDFGGGIGDRSRPTTPPMPPPGHDRPRPMTPSHAPPDDGTVAIRPTTPPLPMEDGMARPSTPPLPKEDDGTATPRSSTPPVPSYDDNRGRQDSSAIAAMPSSPAASVAAASIRDLTAHYDEDRKAAAAHYNQLKRSMDEQSSSTIYHVRPSVLFLKSSPSQLQTRIVVVIHVVGRETLLKRVCLCVC
jgi:hypothetical protein